MRDGLRSKDKLEQVPTLAADRKTGRMIPSPSPSLLEVIRQLLQKVEGTSYPTNDPISIEDLKTYLRCRVAELEVEEGLRPPPPETPERPLSIYRDHWWQPRSQRSRSLSQESFNENEDRTIRNKPVPRPDNPLTNGMQHSDTQKARI